VGKRTISEKEVIRRDLELQMNMAPELASRNPRVKALLEKHYPEFPKEEYEELVKEIYGEVFPHSAFPVWRIEKYERKPSDLVLNIDLNYTKDEIMFIVEKYVTNSRKDYKSKHSVKISRKTPMRWLDYLEIWDLKNGDPPWVNVGDIKMPYDLATGKEPKRGKPWTYEEIAKHLYPGEQTPEELNSAIDRVKKQYRAAYKLICGDKYNPQEFEKIKSQIETENKKILCDECPDRPHCKDPCPALLEELAAIEVKQQHKIVHSSRPLEQYKPTRKILSSDKQFE